MRVLPPLAFLAAAATASVARAEPTTWLALGGGGGGQRSDASGSFDPAATFSASMGVGTSPDHAFVVGGMFRSLTHFNLGTDVSLSVRVATHGFARGGFGLALDVGAAYRYWRGGDYGDVPLQSVLTIGLPAGLQIGLGGNFWNVDVSTGRASLGVFAVLEVDLLRMTVMRKDALEQYWPNPSAVGDVGRGK